MAVAISTAGPYYVSGEIKFSDLRRDFRAQIRKATSGGSETTNLGLNEGSISTAELLRITDVTVTNPIVPDCTENRTSGPLNTGISTDNNLSCSQFRNSIKYVYLEQSGTDENLVINEQEWNSNLDKNINTVVFIGGTCGSNNPSSPALSIEATANNLFIDISGSVLAAGGTGGGNVGFAVTGGPGGDAISISNSSGNNTVISVKSGAKIYAGGGGGEKGKKGADGSGGRCRETEYRQSGCQQGNTVSCRGGWNQYQSGQWCCEWRRGCNANYWWVRCERYYNTSGGKGGEGGNGGTGRGYNNPINLDGSGVDISLRGAGGAGGSSGGGCGAQSGRTGETGGTGGDWNSLGGNTSNTESGGRKGRAITGSGYSVTGSLSSDTIKGSYL